MVKLQTFITRKVCFNFQTKQKSQNYSKKWVRFVNRRDLTVTNNSGMCAIYFEDDLNQDRRTKNTEMGFRSRTHKVHSAHTSIFDSHSRIQKKKKPKDRSTKEDEMKAYTESDQIKTLDDFVSSMFPPGLILERHENAAIFYRLERCPPHNVPEVTATIMIDEALHVKLFKKSSPIPLPVWFRKGGDCKCKRVSILQNFPNFTVLTSTQLIAFHRTFLMNYKTSNTKIHTDNRNTRLI